MSNQLDWPRYSRWTWALAIITAIVLIWMWMTGYGPAVNGGCCTAPVAAATPAATAAAVAPVVTPSVRVMNKAVWDGNKVTFEGTVPSESARQMTIAAASARYGAVNVVDKLTTDANAIGPVTVVLVGTVASEAVKAARADEAAAYYAGATLNNQLMVAATAPAPAARAQDVQCSDKVAIAATFASGSSQLTPEMKLLLDAVVPCITGAFEVGGHTDDVGGAAVNQSLSFRRATTVAGYLVSRGISAKLLVTKGYGETVPLGNNATADERTRNRRIEFRKI